MGGSQGAHVFNEMFPEAIETLYKQNIPLKVIHLAGMREADIVEKRYKDANIEAEVHAFAHDIASIYAKTDFAIARAGAATCTELTICGLPALLIPHPTAARNHQMLNAMSMAKQGGMSVQPQQDMTIEWLVNYLKHLIENNDIIESMRTKLKNSAIDNGTELLSTLVEQTIRDNKYN
jgi:UDP-N-acetylglucosamine--N-acetylmuramyl-(pentapeptide) pyrophosphoryl-undecaprenol N-acetylglucosamine transferase